MRVVMTGLFAVLGVFWLGVASTVAAFTPPSTTGWQRPGAVRAASLHHVSSTTCEEDVDMDMMQSRRRALQRAVVSIGFIAGAAAGTPVTAHAEDAAMYSPKFVQQYDDFTDSGKGWSFRDVKAGKGDGANKGDRVVLDWSGYTIGYFGRPFQAKGGPQGGAFDKDVDYIRTVLGSGKLVPGLESALEGMQPGGVRQVIVPFGPLSYPADDPDHEAVGPKPSTFSGMRALNFVLENPRVDRTLLFNVKVIRVDKPNGKGGFTRG